MVPKAVVAPANTESTVVASTLHNPSDPVTEFSAFNVPLAVKTDSYPPKVIKLLVALT